ncbi:hypothetical protein [Vibrio zhanjiangensis]|uniref:hypothetical protein n=1 Tax=Vibrio zhanjiangensis TaxID=1046128 RepID=UPI0024E057D6|nr:hypothetical protein [Vibrio zhanjiangensis]
MKDIELGRGGGVIAKVQQVKLLRFDMLSDGDILRVNEQRRSQLTWLRYALTEL